MNPRPIRIALATALALGAAGTALAADYVYRDNYTYRLAHAPEWNVSAPDGYCRLRIWVDDRARVQLRGDQIIVDTNSGKRSFDEGSVCTQPLPATNVADFRVTAERGRGQVVEVRAPEPRNGYTGAMTIVDPQNGGDNYELVVSWRNPGSVVEPVATAVVPPVAMAVAGPYDIQTQRCQERVRGQFLGRNPDSSAFLDFTGVPAVEQLNATREVIRGEATGGNRFETRGVHYQCEFDVHSSDVQAAYYDVHGPSRRRYSSLQ
jgi:hypothetical protein